MAQIILASGSPRRKELLQILGLKFSVVESNYKEDLKQNLKPRALAIFLSQAKAKVAAIQYQNAIIIAADTLISFQNKILGKPQSPEDAFKMLWQMRGKAHAVISGFTILDAKSGKMDSHAVETKIFFRKFSAQEIKNYIHTGETLDKAGAYSIQGLGQLLIAKIEGDYTNVVGLPLAALAQSLKKFGIKII